MLHKHHKHLRFWFSSGYFVNYSWEQALTKFQVNICFCLLIHNEFSISTFSHLATSAYNWKLDFKIVLGILFSLPPLFMGTEQFPFPPFCKNLNSFCLSEMTLLYRALLERPLYFENINNAPSTFLQEASRLPLISACWLSTVHWSHLLQYFSKDSNKVYHPEQTPLNYYFSEYC